MHYEVAIIGAGMSGLAAGIRLAHFGKKVCILERHYLWGGLNSFYKQRGHRFDSGLHAVTNWPGAEYHGPRRPMERVSRQLRIPIADFELDPQGYSEIVFSDARLRFENGLSRLTDEIGDRFPTQVDGFLRLARDTELYPDGLSSRPFRSARRWLGEYFSDPLLIEMILCPLLFYGSAVPNDVDVDQFTILFNSIFREGLGRPRRGVRAMLEVLIERYAEAGGELRMKSGVEKLVASEGRVSRIVLESGEELTADVVISSAGLVETMRMRSDLPADTLEDASGQLAFFESIWVLDRPVASLGAGLGASVVFFNHGPRFAWEPPSELVDTRSGVISCPGNFSHATPLDEHLLRVTHLASWPKWFAFEGERYQAEKASQLVRIKKDLARLVGEFEPAITYTDAFTPKTITKWTSHLHGAVYGSPQKRRDGRTDLQNLFLTGTDQGMLGIVGAMVSGVSVANAYGMS